MNVCIIKTGYSELLESGDGKVVSLGDVFRCTVVLSLFKNDNVTWVTSSQAKDLLVGNAFIDNLILIDGNKLTDELFSDFDEFDLLINLEKNRSVCNAINKIKTSRRIGFKWNSAANKTDAYNSTALDIIRLANDHKARNSPEAPCFQESLFHLIGIKEWTDEGYILARLPKSEVLFDIGFNTEVGSKWPTKRWPAKHWNTLESLLKRKGFSISRQQGLNNLNDYIDWINSCRLLVTNDSLCVHLAQALDKPIVMLVGPTFSSEIRLNNKGAKLFPKTDCPHIPCFSGECSYQEHCMETIAPEMVYQMILEFL